MNTEIATDLEAAHQEVEHLDRAELAKLREIKRLEQKVSHWKQKSDRQRAEIAKLLEGKRRRRKYIKHLHRMFDALGWCFKCNVRMESLFHSAGHWTEFLGYRCKECGRVAYFGDDDGC